MAIMTCCRWWQCWRPGSDYGNTGMGMRADPVVTCRQLLTLTLLLPLSLLPLAAVPGELLFHLNLQRNSRLCMHWKTEIRQSKEVALEKESRRNGIESYWPSTDLSYILERHANARSERKFLRIGWFLWIFLRFKVLSFTARGRGK